MSIRFRCQCGQKLKTADDTVGKRAQCTKCHKWLRIPESATYDTVAQALQPKKDHTVNMDDTIDAALHKKEPASPPPPSANAKGHVVVADAVQADLDKLCDTLRNHGYAVTAVTDGGEVIGAIRKSVPDAAVIDVNLENIGGFQVVRQIRDVANDMNKEVWKMPVIMTCLSMRGRDKQYAVSVGVQGYFSKPINTAKICSQLEKEIGKYRTS